MSVPRPLTRRQSIAAAGGASLLLTLGLGAPPVLAQGAYPTRTVTFVDSWPPGGPSDILARSIASVLDKTSLAQMRDCGEPDLRDVENGERKSEVA